MGFSSMQQISKRSTELPSDFVLVLDFEGSELVEKADDAVTKVNLPWMLANSQEFLPNTVCGMCSYAQEPLISCNCPR